MKVRIVKRGESWIVRKYDHVMHYSDFSAAWKAVFGVRPYA